ncbi:LamG domain-containing protein [Jidongwangia harbinensis]|uniref:LamG domain-containing protein n=1 Tax=Jidongwangia harbinensis TaxID=2878561 RepID=UPI001CD928BF|nr:LamG domain-containing protein [Jidongwangia harbinensis]MCA2214258.1 LamG domain-containing protein [Jidongwangia harbinensis]
MFTGVIAAVLVAGLAGAGGPADRDVHPHLRPHLVAFYDFDHPVPGDPALERDRGRSGTEIELVHGGAAMRVADRAYPGGGTVLQTGPVDGAANDWKAGAWSAGGVRTLRALNATEGITVLGWFKRQADGPAPGFGAIGLAGVLTGNSDGHAVRALLELIDVNGTLRLAALGRRLDDGNSQILAAQADWRALLPRDEWVHLAATFDFTAGTMALYRNGAPVDGFYTRTDDPWLIGGPGPHVTSATDPRGIKIGGSFPWPGSADRNPCACRMDALMVLDRSLPARDITNQYRYMTRG